MDKLDPSLAYPAGSPDDTNGPDYGEVIAGRDVEGRWLHPVTGNPVDFAVPDPDPETGWRAADILRFEQDARTHPLEPITPAPSLDDLPGDIAAMVSEHNVMPAQEVGGYAVLTDPTNVDDFGHAHYLVNIAGQETCGRDGEPWPCRAWSMIEQTDPEDQERLVAKLAPALGVGQDQLLEFIRAQKTTPPPAAQE